MSDFEKLLADLRAAAAGAPYTEALREELVRRGCPGFPGRPVEKIDALTRTPGRSRRTSSCPPHDRWKGADRCIRAGRSGSSAVEHTTYRTAV